MRSTCKYPAFAYPAIIVDFRSPTRMPASSARVTCSPPHSAAWFAGILADRFGRVRTLQITSSGSLSSRFCAAFAQNYTQLLVFRGLMGFGLGGEWAAGAVLMGEVIRARSIAARPSGAFQSGWAIGWAIAAILSTFAVCHPAARHCLAALFWIGLFPAFLGVLRAPLVDDPPVFKAAQERIAGGAPRSTALEIFSPDMIRTTILTSLLATGAQGGYYAITTWLPTFSKRIAACRDRHRQLYRPSSSWAPRRLSVSAYLADRIGRRANFILVCGVFDRYRRPPIRNSRSATP